jgi:hypothetical protein
MEYCIESAVVERNVAKFELAQEQITQNAFLYWSRQSSVMPYRLLSEIIK